MSLNAVISIKELGILHWIDSFDTRKDISVLLTNVETLRTNPLNILMTPAQIESDVLKNSIAE